MDHDKKKKLIAVYKKAKGCGEPAATRWLSRAVGRFARAFRWETENLRLRFLNCKTEYLQALVIQPSSFTGVRLSKKNRDLLMESPERYATYTQTLLLR